MPWADWYPEMSDLPKVLFTLAAPREDFAPLEGVASLLLPARGFVPLSREETLSHLAECEGVISQGELRIDEEILDAAPSLRLVANAAMGTDNLDLEALRRRGIVATRTPDAFAESTADLTLGLILDLTRRIAEGDRHVRSGQWARGLEPLRWEGSLLAGKVLGIIGYGRIAQRVERRARAFGMEVVHTRRHPDDAPGCRPLEALLAESDIVVALCPLTPETRHLVNAERLAMMKPGSRFINMARGKVMDEAAVVEALRSGHLAGAAFDVFEHEPSVSPELFEMEQVVLTPHIGGATREERRGGRLEAAAEAARFFRGEPLLHAL